MNKFNPLAGTIPESVYMFFQMTFAIITPALIAGALADRMKFSAFLWFMGVLRDRMGAREDRFLATVFLGSGLLFLAITFASSAVIGGVMMAYEAIPGKLMDSGTYTFARALAYEFANVYALRMAGVFMISTCTLAIRVGMFPRWMALLGYLLALFLLLSTVSFWFEDRIGVHPPVWNVIAFGRYPLSIYSGAVQFFLCWIVPFGLASFYPSVRMLGRTVHPEYAPLVPVVALAFLTLAISVWNIGTRHYSSTGS